MYRLSENVKKRPPNETPSALTQTLYLVIIMSGSRKSSPGFCKKTAFSVSHGYGRDSVFRFSIPYRKLFSSPEPGQNSPNLEDVMHGTFV